MKVKSTVEVFEIERLRNYYRCSRTFEGLKPARERVTASGRMISKNVRRKTRGRGAVDPGRDDVVGAITASRHAR